MDASKPLEASKQAATTADNPQIVEVDFQGLNEGPVSSPLKLPGVTIVCENMSVGYMPLPYGKYLITNGECTITYGKEFSSFDYDGIGTLGPFSVKVSLSRTGGSNKNNVSKVVSTGIVQWSKLRFA